MIFAHAWILHNCPIYTSREHNFMRAADLAYKYFTSIMPREQSYSSGFFSAVKNIKMEKFIKKQ